MVNQDVGLIFDWELSLQGVGIGVHLCIVLLPVLPHKKKYQILPGKMKTNLLIICYVKGIKHNAWGPGSAQLQSKYNSSPVHWTPPENVKEGRPPP